MTTDSSNTTDQTDDTENSLAKYAVRKRRQIEIEAKMLCNHEFTVAKKEGIFYCTKCAKILGTDIYVDFKSGLGV